MFCLSELDFSKQILGCGDGPACFNAEWSRIGGSVISVDPIYEFNVAEIRSRIDEVYPQIIDQVSKNKNDFVWKNIVNVDELGKVRMDAMTIFLNDYEEGRKSGRYIAASLPRLPFEDNAFDLALCSHYLFLYSEHVSQEQHLLSMKELCRVASEVRVYPLLSMGNNIKSSHLEPVISALKDIGISISFVPVDYEFQKGATEMLVAKYA
ncbi:MAG: class I SAM-dependent methyltransferase [Methylococcales bacterium]|nr:MAG: class I SAM-dependent methyltransferase [Methylococcales bacterium]